MQFLYSGGCNNLEVSATDVLELMAASSFFQLEGLLRYTEARCAEIIDIDNVVAMYIHAKVNWIHSWNKIYLFFTSKTAFTLHDMRDKLSLHHWAANNSYNPYRVAYILQPFVFTQQVYNASKLMEYCQGFLLQNMVALLTYDDSVKRLLFAKKIPNHDVLSGLLTTLQQRIKSRRSSVNNTTSNMSQNMTKPSPINAKTNHNNSTSGISKHSNNSNALNRSNHNLNEWATTMMTMRRRRISKFSMCWWGFSFRRL